MSEMTGRVAQAITAAGMEWKKNNGGDSVSWADVPDEIFARAAISAMHEPTEDMLFVGSNEDAGYSDSDLRISWQLMIDEALK